MPSRPAAEAIATALGHGESYLVGRERKDWNPTAYIVDKIAQMPQAKRAAWLAALREEPQDTPRIQPFARDLLARLAVGDH
jgi:hypothetical protein